MKEVTQKRVGVFETNSSSTHSICIAKEAELSIPTSLHFSFGEFGWEFDTLHSMSEKSSYLYTGLFSNDRHSDIAKIAQTLTSRGIEVTTEDAIGQMRSYVDSKGETQEYMSYDNIGYVDHGDDLKEFLDAICEDDEKLMRFLFSDLSFIITGNNNDDHNVDICVSYPHDEYFKGN